MSQTEEEDKSLEGDLSKIEKSDLPNRVQNNGHKDGHWGQRARHKQSKNFSKENITKKES